jgi:hypothetical protein
MISSESGFPAPRVPAGEIGARPESNLAYRWMKAILYGALILAVAEYAALRFRDTLGIGEHGSMMIEVVLSVGWFAIAAALTGSVLRRKLPRFSQRWWVVLHAAWGLACAIFYLSLPGWDNTVLNRITIGPINLGLVFFIVVGAAYGALLGSLQAIVLRTAARRVGMWVGLSVLAGSALLWTVSESTYGLQSGYSELFQVTMTLIADIVYGAILLPAVQRLQPLEAPGALSAA